MAPADIIYHFPRCMELLQRTVDLLDDPDGDSLEAYSLECAIRDMLKNFETKKGANREFQINH